MPSFHLLRVKDDVLNDAEASTTETVSPSQIDDGSLTEFVATLDNNEQAVNKARQLAWPRLVLTDTAD